MDNHEEVGGEVRGGADYGWQYVVCMGVTNELSYNFYFRVCIKKKWVKELLSLSLVSMGGYNWKTK